MSSVRNGLLGALAALGITGGLFATGVVRLGSPESETAPTAEEQQEGGRRRGRNKGDNLRSLAYLGEIPLTDETRKKSGVQRHEAEASDRYVLANPVGGGRRRGKSIREATLWDAQGKQLHSWSSDSPSEKQAWAIARLDRDGYLYVIVNSTALVKLDWNSNVVWVVQGHFHHDFTIAQDGTIAALIGRKRVIELPPGASPHGRSRAQILDHGVAFIDPAGNPTGQVWMYDVMSNTPAFHRTLRRGLRATGNAAVIEDEDAGEARGAARVAGRRHRPLDVFHANSILMLPREVPGLGNAGDLLISLRNMNTVASFDRDTQTPGWVWGQSELLRQHDSTLTPEGHVVLFDNRNEADNSRAVIVDPISSTIVRTIGGPGNQGPLRFFSSGRGLAQALPNGNVMVVVSNEGRALEVAKDDQIVWEFWSPWMGEGTRKPIRASRLDEDVQDTLASIVHGERPPPVVSARSPKSVRLEIVRPAHPPGLSPTGHATPVPPRPQ
ncbi:MAG: arylsulfotransferase family protein [Nannocystales bacterium]